MVTKRMGLVMAMAAMVMCPLAAFAAGDPVGEWNMKMDFQGQAVEGKLVVTKGDDGALGGTWTGQRGESKIEEAKFEDPTFTFTRKIEGPQGEIVLKFVGKVEGDAITGEYQTDMGNMPVTGTRAAAAAAAPVELVLPEMSDPELAAQFKKFNEILLAHDIETLMTYYTDDFESGDGMDKAGYQAFLQGAKDSQALDGMTVKMADMKVNIEGEKAKIEGLVVEGSFGVLTINFDLVKADGKWLIKYQEQY